LTYHLHLDFPQPEDASAKIWRYVAFWKFHDLIDKGALYFSRPDQFPDPWEGHFTRADVRAWPDRYPHIPMDMQAAHIRKVVGLCCWHINEFESEALWRLYLPDSEGVAIQSTVQGLVGSFDDNPNQHVSLGLVRYVDYENFKINWINELLPLFYKRREFEHERELRAIVGLRRTDENGVLHWIRRPLDGGLHVTVALSTLLQKVVLAPGASASLQEKVLGIMEGVGMDPGRVTRSRLEGEPDYELPIRKLREEVGRQAPNHATAPDGWRRR